MGRLSFVHKAGTDPDNSIDDLAARPGVFDGVAINITWRQLEPTPGQIDFRSLDAALTVVRTYNAAHPATPLGVRLRIFAGTSAPDWAKQLGGGGVEVRDNKEHQGQVVTIGRFWSRPFIDAWRDLQRRLASRYDTDELIREVSVTSCASRGDEPFILPTDAEFSLQNMHAAGFSDANYKSCLMGAIDDYLPWRVTHLDYTVNPFHDTDSGFRPDPGFSIQVMRAWHSRMGARGSLMNHGLFVPVREGVAPIYDEMKRLGGDIEFQMFSPVTDYWDSAVTYAAQAGATVVELWPPLSNARLPGLSATPNDQLASWARKLKSNPTH